MPKPKGWTDAMLRKRDRLVKKMQQNPDVKNPWAAATSAVKREWQERYGWGKRRKRR